MERYLIHHGILGQKWGVRRYQNADGSLTSEGQKRYLVKYGFKDKQADKYAVYGTKSTRATEIKKGATLYRTIATKDEDPKGPKYVTFYQGDRSFYRGYGADWIAGTQGVKKISDMREKQYTLKEDLKIATREEMNKIYDEVICKDKKAMIEAGKAYATSIVNNRYQMHIDDYKELAKSFDENKEYKMSKKTIEKYGLNEETAKYYSSIIENTYKELANTTIKELTTDSGIDKLFKYSQGYGNNDYTKNKMIEELKKRGYNAMSDEAGIGGHNGYSRETRQALIVFDGEQSFESNSKTVGISESEYQKSVKEWNKYYKKLNNNIPKMSS